MTHNAFYNEEGKLHNLEAPAWEGANWEEWWVNGVRHREDGPAVTRPDETQEWWVNGKLHREDGPAIYNEKFGREEWWVEGARHRVDGPAVFYNNSSLYHEWWIEGVRKKAPADYIHPLDTKKKELSQNAPNKIIQVIRKSG